MRSRTDKNQISSVNSRRLRLATALVAAIAVAACAPEGRVAPEPVRPVKTTIVEAPREARTLTFSGAVRPRIESALGFRVAGKIVARSVNVGDRVEVNSVIARLDETDLRLAEDAARAAVASAVTRREVAKDNFERAKALLPKGAVAQITYDNARNESVAADSALDSAQAQLRQTTNAVGYATLKADKAGTITTVTGEPGQVVSAGQAVVTLAEAGQTEIAVAVPEQEAGQLAIGQPAEITLWAGPRASVRGRIREIAGQADPVSRTYAVRIAVAAPPRAMRLGMTATVSLTVNEEAAPMVLPITALTEGEGGLAAFVVDQVNQVVRKTPVTVAGMADEGARIASGLQAGDMVVTGGVQFLRDGMHVRLADEGTPAGAR